MPSRPPGRAVWQLPVPPITFPVGRAPFRFRCARARPGDASRDAFLDDAELKLRGYALYLERRLPGRRARIDTLPIEVQVNACAVQLVQERDEILKAAAEAVDAPCRDDIKLVPHNGTAQAIEPRPLVTPIGVAHAVVAELGYHPPAAPLCRGH